MEKSWIFVEFFPTLATIEYSLKIPKPKPNKSFIVKIHYFIRLLTPVRSLVGVRARPDPVRASGADVPAAVAGRRGGGIVRPDKTKALGCVLCPAASRGETGAPGRTRTGRKAGLYSLQ